MLRQLGTAALVISAITACDRPADGPEPRSADTGEPTVWVTAVCPAQTINPVFDASEELGGIPADFVATAVVRCRNEFREVPGEGTWVVQITERADTPVSQLVTLLRRPSEPTSPGATCPDIAYSVPYFALVDAEGRALLPDVPTEVCGKPREEVTNLLGTLPYQTVTETRIALGQSVSPNDGCHDLRKDTIAVASPMPAPAAPMWSSGPEIHVCVYTKTGEYGQLETGYLLTGQESAALKAMLGAAGPAAPCDKPNTRFAVLTAWNGSSATVELDGCFRVHRPNNTLGQLDEGVVAGLTQH